MTEQVLNEITMETKPRYDYHIKSTYMIVSKMAYLLGIEKRIFDNENEPPQLEWYKQLENDKNARIVRNLCRIRTAFETHYRFIVVEIKDNLKNLGSLPQYIPQDALQQLSEDGIELQKANYLPQKYVIDLNKHISNRINNCKSLFPLWVQWEYIKNLFVMPNGTTESGCKSAYTEFQANKKFYPYQVYINWTLMDRGNILYNDRKFCTLLYEENRDTFDDISKVTDAGEITKSGIYDFLDKSERCCVVVDCENVDPYKLYATLNNLNQEALLNKIVKIILYDDVHTYSAWGVLKDFTSIEVEHQTIERIKENKSLVDIRLAVGTATEYYEHNIDSFILVSSDSDYWGMISALPKVNFLVMVESANVSPAMKEALLTEGITYCYIDDFCTGNSTKLQTRTLLTEIRHRLDAACNFNINSILEEAYLVARANLSEAERAQFYNKYIKTMRAVIDKDGAVSIQLGE